MQLPEAHYVFLVHANQNRRRKKVLAALGELKIRSFEFVALKGYPRHPGFDALVSQAGRPIPDTQRKRFHISEKPHLPEKWKKIFREVVDRTDALFIPGGSNIPAAFYGEKQYVEGMSSTPVRSLYEYALLSFLLNGDDPYLVRRPAYVVVGFCYGMQAMNVALGGTLWQSIPVELYKQQYVEDVIAAGPENMHRNYHLAVYPTPAELYRGWFHPLKVVVDSPWLKGERGIYVLSNHQQAVRQLGRNLKILATSEDGKVAEVMQHTRFPNVLAVQGHPERRFAWNRLGTFPPATRRFHEGFFAQLRKVMEESRRERAARAARAARATQVR